MKTNSSSWCVLTPSLRRNIMIAPRRTSQHCEGPLFPARPMQRMHCRLPAERMGWRTYPCAGNYLHWLCTACVAAAALPRPEPDGQRSADPATPDQPAQASQGRAESNSPRSPRCGQQRAAHGAPPPGLPPAQRHGRVLADSHARFSGSAAHTVPAASAGTAGFKAMILPGSSLFDFYRIVS